MRLRTFFAAACLAAMCSMSCGDIAIGTPLGRWKAAKIIDHTAATVEGLTPRRTAEARNELRIVYWHTSHGSQIADGIEGMDAFYGGAGMFATGGVDGPFFDDIYECDIGNSNGGPDWDVRTRAWLDSRPDVNVVMWSWCGQVGDSESDEIVTEYLADMAALERDYADVAFVYMTGHSNGTGLGGDLHRRNRMIRDFCEDRGKWLYDFYDIECYDPDGRYFGDRNVDDACNYAGGNWATEWQAAHAEGRGGGWWECGSAHSQPLNANQKAKAAWQLWCAIAESR
jgi:hypothetical protein